MDFNDFYIILHGFNGFQWFLYYFIWFSMVSNDFYIILRGFQWYSMIFISFLTVFDGFEEVFSNKNTKIHVWPYELEAFFMQINMPVTNNIETRSKRSIICRKVFVNINMFHQSQKRLLAILLIYILALDTYFRFSYITACNIFGLALIGLPFGSGKNII